uniref:SMI1/KNR4 family protein n=1 Tax=Streptomyces sp. NBC_00008 TaxID=2903610 RepID=A0AAU2VM69_9ACTN
MTDLELLAAFPAKGKETGMVRNDWDLAESALGVTFPSSFMRFLEVFGGSQFDDFLTVYRAGANNEYLDLVSRTCAARSAMTETTSRPHIKELLHRRGLAPDQLIRWGGTDNADFCFLLPDKHPGKWGVLIVAGRGDAYDLFEGPVETYLLHVLRREYVSDVFPDDFPDDNPGYERRPNA